MLPSPPGGSDNPLKTVANAKTANVTLPPGGSDNPLKTVANAKTANVTLPPGGSDAVAAGEGLPQLDFQFDDRLNAYPTLL